MTEHERYAWAIINEALDKIDYQTVWRAIDDWTDGYFDEEDARMVYDIVAGTEVRLVP